MHPLYLKLIQWDLNGFYKKYSELELIIQKQSPNMICIQYVSNFNDKSIG